MMLELTIISMCLWILAFSILEARFTVERLLIVDLVTVVERGSTGLTMVTAFGPDQVQALRRPLFVGLENPFWCPLIPLTDEPAHQFRHSYT